MLRHALLVAPVALTAFAQNTPVTTFDFPVDLSQVSSSEKAQWCGAQLTTCSTLCSNAVSANTCDITPQLSYLCLCKGNNSAPGLQYYTQTVPTFVCGESYRQCAIVAAANAVTNSSGPEACTNNIQKKCGLLNPATANIAPPPASSSSTGAPNPTGGAPPASTTKPPNGAPTHLAFIGNSAAALVAGAALYLL